MTEKRQTLDSTSWLCLSHMNNATGDCLGHREKHPEHSDKRWSLGRTHRLQDVSCLCLQHMDTSRSSCLLLCLLRVWRIFYILTYLYSFGLENKGLSCCEKEHNIFTVLDLCAVIQTQNNQIKVMKWGSGVLTANSGPLSRSKHRLTAGWYDVL